MKELMLGNEAVARGAWESGVSVATAYPGTPSTEILEAIAQYPEIHSEWCTNEKVALEVALGASFVGARALAVMKHVGLNVAADPFFSSSYIGATGGLVVVSADDPGCHSSQNEQDNRNYARAAKMPVLEPSDSEEARRFTKLAYEISEKYDTPVLLRLTTRISHTRTVVHPESRKEPSKPEYERDFSKRTLLPLNARIRHKVVEERMIRLKKFSENLDENRVIMNGGDIGIVTDSISYQYVREIMPDVSVLKLAMPWPFPENKIKEFAQKVKKLIVVEENDPFIEGEIKKLGIKVTGKDKIPLLNELNPSIIAEKLDIDFGKDSCPTIKDLPPRPPVMCPGCPHLGIFNMIKKLRLIPVGDIGCYTLGALPPLNAMDTCVDMGASISNAYGMQLAMDKEEKRRVVAVIGDSTFFHSGVTPLINTYYNGGIGTILILDNRTTAMTGHQGHPGTGKTLSKKTGHRIDLEKMIKGIGIKHVYSIKPYDLAEIESVLKRETERDDISVVIVYGWCTLLKDFDRKKAYIVDCETCTGCLLCTKMGCPAISIENEKATIDKFLCVGCGLCAQICPTESIKER